MYSVTISIKCTAKCVDHHLFKQCWLYHEIQAYKSQGRTKDAKQRSWNPFTWHLIGEIKKNFLSKWSPKVKHLSCNTTRDIFLLHIGLKKSLHTTWQKQVSYNLPHSTSVHLNKEVNPLPAACNNNQNVFSRDAGK